MAFRSNAPHFWNWLASQKQILQALNIEGVNTGDPHILNFGEVELADGKGRELALIDVDDSGTHASLLGDFLRYFVGNQISPFAVNADALWSAYVTGHSGTKATKPQVLVDIEGKSSNHFDKKQADLISKLVDGKLFTDKAELSSIDTAPADIAQIFRDSWVAMQTELKPYKRVLDRGYKVKEGGGSQGLVRFWFLVEDSNSQLHVLEFKLETDPATALFSPQADQLTRFQTVSQVYRPQDVVGPYKFVQAGTHTYLLRERLASLMKFDPAKITDPQDIQDATDVSLYLANKMGRWQANQSAGSVLAQNLNGAGGAGIRAAFLQLAQSYIALMKQEQSNAGK
jgi:hypothetical protein